MDGFQGRLELVSPCSTSQGPQLFSKEEDLLPLAWVTQPETGRMTCFCGRRGLHYRGGRCILEGAWRDIHGMKRQTE